MTEGRAILIAGAAHLALLGLLSMTWSAMHDSLPAFAEAVPVEIVEISDLPRVTEPPKPSIEAAPQETIEAQAPEPAPEETAEAEPEPTPAPPEPAPAEVPTPEAKPTPKPEPKVEAKPKAEAKAKAEKKAPIEEAAKPAEPKAIDPTPAETRMVAAATKAAVPATIETKPKDVLAPKSLDKAASVQVASRPDGPAKTTRMDTRTAAEPAQATATAKKTAKNEPAANPPAPNPRSADAPAQSTPGQAPAVAGKDGKKPDAHRLDAAELANLIDKSLPKAARKTVASDDFASSIERSLPRQARLDTRATATLAQAIRNQVYPCWNPPSGTIDEAGVTVTLMLELSIDGTVVGSPDVVGSTGFRSSSDPLARAFIDSAKRAVLRCSPLKLPPELYEDWRRVELIFDPVNVARN